jgi:hypothetical protein
MKIKFKYYIPHIGKRWVCVAYYKSKHWRIYDNGAHYAVKSQKQIDNLIGEVAEEMHVSRENIKIVIPQSIKFKEVGKK